MLYRMSIIRSVSSTQNHYSFISAGILSRSIDYMHLHHTKDHAPTISTYNTLQTHQKMGNKESNDDFSKSSSFNMQKHQEAMAQLNANYTHQNINLDVGYGPIIKPQVTQAEFKAIHRTCSIYKPSINITSQNASTLKIEFEYDSDQGNKLQIHMGVHKVEQDLQSHITQHIDSEIYYQTLLAAGKKVRFQNAYSIQKLSKIVGCTIILRMLSQTSTEITEYSIKNVGQNHWKTLLQKLQINGLVTQLDNIYRGGGQSDDCIICFCQKVNTIIQPCNHLCLCSACSEEVRKTTNICPICRTPIKSFKRIKTTMQ